MSRFAAEAPTADIAANTRFIHSSFSQEAYVWMLADAAGK